jgi:hypothetical protein
MNSSRVLMAVIITKIRAMNSRGMMLEGHVAGMERRGVHEVLMGKPGGNKAIGGPRSRSENIIKMNLTEM